VGELDNAVLTGRSLYPAVEDGAGAGSYAPVDPHADIPKIHGFLYANDSLVADVFHAPDSQFDRTEWESKYMMRPTFKADLGDAFHPWDGPEAILEWDSYSDSSFRPVVKDGDHTVIAHVGYVLATDIALPRSSPSIPNLSRSGRDVAQWKKYLSEEVNHYLAQGGIAYVAARPGDNIVWSGDQKWDLYQLNEDAFLVLADPNGQVLQVLEVIEKRPKGVGTMALEFIGFTLDVLTILDLAAIGIRLALIAARGARFGLQKILSLVLRKTEREALLSVSKTLPGIAVSTRGLLPVEHLVRRTFIMGEDLAKFRGLMAGARTETGFYDIVIHGDSTSFQILVKTVDGKGVWRDVSAREIADIVRPRLAAGDKIRLLSCDVGATGGPAQELADELNRTVWASSTSVPAVPKGAGLQKAFVPKDGGTFSEFVPSRGAANLRTGKVTANEVTGEINAHPRPPGPRP